jgi:hypothetical protein
LVAGALTEVVWPAKRGNEMALGVKGLLELVTESGDETRGVANL